MMKNKLPNETYQELISRQKTQYAAGLIDGAEYANVDFKNNECEESFGVFDPSDTYSKGFAVGYRRKMRELRNENK